MRIQHVVAVLLLVSILPASPALGQQTGSTAVDLDMPNLAAPIPPTGPQTTSVDVRYEWEDGIATENVTIELAYVDGPSWLSANVSPSTIEIDTANRPQGIETRIVTVNLEVSEQATAYTEATGTFQATASGTGTLPSAETEAELSIEAGFAGSLAADLPEGGNVTAWGGLLERVPITLENTANGPLEVDIIVDRFPADALAEAPRTVNLSHEAGNRTVTTYIDVRVPWSLSVDGPAEILLEPQHATRGTELAERRVAFELEGKSAVPIPSPGPGISLIAVALAVLFGRT